jgi:hypothetical protein
MANMGGMIRKIEPVARPRVAAMIPQMSVQVS